MQLGNYIGGAWCAPADGQYMPVTSPVDGIKLADVALSGPADVDQAVKAATEAFPSWSALTVKSRATIMYRFHALMSKHMEELSELVVRENGKNIAEARASVAKGQETVEWACSLPQLCQGKVLQVSRGIECRDQRDPVGVVACVVPFNFPCMVPMWTIPIALTLGNCVIVKPSEKVPCTLYRVAELLAEAGVPGGAFQLVNGAAPVVNALCDHPGIGALSFVGSSHVAQLVAERCHSVNKRVLALGGAKNHLVALPDCHVASAAQDIVASFAGCAGQRCMAASVLICVGNVEGLVDEVVRLAALLKPGVAAGEVGAIIDAASQAKILRYINEAEASGVRVLLDGRPWSQRSPGTWVGPTVLAHASAADAAVCDEIFGPVISVLQVATWDEALAIENGSPFGNAASIYTTSGAHADHFSSRFRAGMIGVNVGVPVPREPFAFGGLAGTRSKFGEGDITGEGALEFFTTRRKVTTRWPAVAAAAAAHAPAERKGNGAAAAAGGDAASFVGQM
ncbi:Aldehyde/histidinol dehydrogenase [Tribonema minus]|uniref:methylmalonate-semialdehyde dehydrogenase (CoA acylating) n=1 Tax=Tribonema minus TaxID=303371 RepID=A0A836CA02_9STRA|nr:Aldehyde/histidinol dehydrogenase [Tribonema minus]